MSTFTLFIAILSLLTAGGLFFFLWGRGILAAPIRNNPTVEIPVMIVTSDLNNQSKCGDKSFRGTIEIDLFYLFPTPNAEVKLKANIRRRTNCSVSLAKTDLGIFRNDTVETVSFSGELTDLCQDADFTVSVCAVNQGPGSTTIAESERVDIPALEYSVSMRTQVSTSNGRDFSFDINIGCCGAGLEQTIKFTNISGVRDLSAAPASFTCAAGATPTITISGKKIDENQVGVFTVKADSLVGDCILGSVQVE